MPGTRIRSTGTSPTPRAALPGAPPSSATGGELDEIHQPGQDPDRNRLVPFGESGIHELPDPITSTNTIELFCDEEPVG